MPNENEPAAFAFHGLQRVFHERSRLSILSSLAAHPAGLAFNDLKQLCDLTDGNLSRQIQMLQEELLVDVNKGYHGKRPQTVCKLTDDGRARFLAYLGELERVIRTAAKSQDVPARIVQTRPTA